jgi:hypothetical protein
MAKKFNGVITSKTIMGQDEELPEPQEPQDGELFLILNKIKRNCGPTSEINRLCDRALELIK